METTFPRPRYLAPNRQQVRLLPTDLDATLPRTHPARAVWAFVERCDLTPLYAKILAVEGHAGRPAIDPAILVGLWLLATLDGVGSARALDRLTGAHDAYRWMCGGVGVNHHALSDFRVEHEAFLDSLLAHSVAALVSAGLASLEEIAIDGRRTRAAASAPSFRSRGALERMRAEAKARVEFLKNEVLEEADASERRVQAARRRAAEDLEKRISEALDHMPEAEAAKARNRKKRRLTKNGAQPKDETPPGDTSPAAPSGQTSPHSPPPGPEGSVPPEASPEDEEAEGQPEDQATAGSTTRTTDGFGDAPADLARVSMTDPEARVMKMADGG
jgi:transposase